MEIAGVQAAVGVLSSKWSVAILAELSGGTRRFNELLRSKGYEPRGGEAKDGDGWASWRNRTDQLFAALFPPGD